MNNPERKIISLDGEGRETVLPSGMQSVGILVEQIVRRVGQTRIKNDNKPGWDVVPVKKEGS